MVDFNSLAQVNALHQQRESVAHSIRTLDSGGTVTQFSVGSPPPVAGSIAPVVALPMVMCQVPSASPELVAAVRAWLVQRQGDLDKQLAELGVTSLPGGGR